MQTQAASSLVSSDQRLAREWKTVCAMIRIYCRDHHKSTPTQCPECEDLTRYVNQRLDRCHFGTEKPTCAKCPVHCYRSERREQIKTVMRYAGPRMMWEHPWLSLRHLLDGWFQRPHATGKPAKSK